MIHSVKGKVGFGFGASLLILAAIGAAAEHGLRQARNAAARVSHSHTVIEVLGNILREQVDAESGARGYVLSGDTAHLTWYHIAMYRTSSDLDRLDSLVADNPAQVARQRELAPLVQRKIAMARETVGLYDGGSRDVARSAVASQQGIALGDSIRVLVSRMSEGEQALLTSRVAEEDAQQRTATEIILFGFCVACIIAGLARWAVVSDLRERERLHLELRTAVDEARAASQAKSEFLARMSHELRTPLNSVIGFSNVLMKKNQGALAPPMLEYIERIRTNGVQLLAIINDILDISKVESGRMDLVLENVDVRELVVAAVGQLVERGTGVPRLEVDIPADVAPLRTDPDKLRQVLLNLVSNAAKFAFGGRVVLRGVAQPHTRTLQRIDVIDTGVGIPPERLASVFEAFEQADSTISRRFGGTGLGLAIARSMCECLDYRLTVVSEVGRGSTFSILLTPDAPQLLSHVPPERA